MVLCLAVPSNVSRNINVRLFVDLYRPYPALTFIFPWVVVHCGESPSGPSTATNDTPLLEVPRSRLSAVKKKELLGITRSLESLNYPPEPEDVSMYDDPLRAEEVKPLRRQDYVSLAIARCPDAAEPLAAKSQELRRILALPLPEDPPYARPTTHIRSILSGLAAIKDLRLREQYLAKCLGLEEELHRVRGGMQGNKKNHHPQSSTSGRGARGGGSQKGGARTPAAVSQDFYLPDFTATAKSPHETTSHGKQRNDSQHQSRSSKSATGEGNGSMFIGAQEHEAMRAFAEAVRNTLEGNAEEREGRGLKRKMEWEA
ncbi:hypothetical protein QFC19_002303 [Naganishia cerealis]|uniref:Uncharacterized protein n=1 Tax=Naganishia cerealis TaxID=610337 RepID=A0ACC2WDF3_9TREE|nr:hypothetical protein QFC19_002303 [Naganishia cerealis]